MPWVTPERVRTKIEGELLASNEYFDKVKLKSSGFLSVRGQKHPFRILLRTPGGNFVVAIGKSVEDIDPQWSILEGVLLDIRKYNANDSVSDICHCLLLKCSGFWTKYLSEKDDLKNDEFNKTFDLQNEKLVGMYKCSLWKRTPIKLYLSENYIGTSKIDDLGKLETSLIRWNDVTAIKKRKCLARDTAISIHYTTKEDKQQHELFMYGFSKRDEVAGVMDQLWDISMHKLLRSAENNSSLLAHSSHRRPSGQQSSLKDIGDKNRLKTQHSELNYNRKFRLPSEEKHLLKFRCKTCEAGRDFLVGKMHISKHFLCYETTKGRDIRIVIPFREMKNVEFEISIIGLQKRVIKVIDRHRKYYFILDSQKQRDNVYKAIVDKWNRALSECNLLSFVEVPVIINKISVTGMGNLLNNSKEFSDNFMKNQENITAEWELYFKKHGQKSGMAEDTSELFSLLKAGGIPDIHRNWVWTLFSGANYKYHCAPYLGYYHTLKQQSISEDVLEEIRKDIGRSFPEHEFFQTPEGLASLENVLRAYAIRNPIIGYCQSMNMITALLLVYLPEEWAFWVLASICEDLAPENYGQHMIGSIVYQSTFEDLFENNLPSLYAHLKKVDVQIGMITQGWFICLFIGFLPLEIALQILDMFFFLRGTMLYAVGLGVFKSFESEIMAMDEADEIVVYLRDIKFCPDLLKNAFRYLDKLNPNRIEEMRSAGKIEVIRAMEETTRMSAIRMVLDKGTRFELAELHEIFTVFQRTASSETFSMDEKQFEELLMELVPWIVWRKDLIIPLFRSGSKRDSLTFVDVVSILSNVCKGNLRERLEFYFNLHCTSDDGLLDEGDYYRTLDAVVRSYYNEELYESDLRTLVSWTFKEADKNNIERVGFTDICTLLLPSMLPTNGEQLSPNEEHDAQLGLLKHFLLQ